MRLKGEDKDKSSTEERESLKKGKPWEKISGYAVD